MQSIVLRLGAVVLALLMAWPVSAALQAPRRLAHYSHQRWIEGSEAPVPVRALAQGPDGFLWVAGSDGLYRFDGVRFELVTPPGGTQVHNSPTVLLVTRGGEVWTNFDSSHRFAVYRRGHLRVPDAPPAPSRIVSMAEGNDGSIWALTATFDAEVLRFHDGTWRTYNAADGLPKINSTNLLVAADGALWVACLTGVARLPAGASRFEIVLHAKEPRVSKDAQGRIWISDSTGTYPLTGPGGRGPPPAISPYPTGQTLIRGAPLHDRDGNLWIATRYDGVQRWSKSASGAVQVENFNSRDGLSSDVTHGLLADREGNVWVGTEGGLDKFRPATVVAEPALGAPAYYGDKLLTTADGSVVIGQAQTIYKVAPGGTPRPIITDVPEPQCLSEAPDGALWIGRPTQIVVWANGKIRERIERPDQTARHNIIFDCTFDAHGDFWISAMGGGAHRYRAGHWESMVAPGDRMDRFPTTMERTAHGVAVQTGDRLVLVDGDRRQVVPLDQGPGGINFLMLYASGDDLFAGSAYGLSRVRGNHAQTLPAPAVSTAYRINGMVRTPTGDVWLTYPQSLVLYPAAQFERAFIDGALPMPPLSLGRGDGLTSDPHSHSQRALVRGGDGRLWIATETGTFWMDPAHVVRNSLPPGLSIRSLKSDGRVYPDPATLTLKAAPADIEIDFAVLSFADPGRVRARYMLEGYDRHWVDPGMRRQAFYTNLPPGKYTFRLVGANNDGVWSHRAAALAFEIPPTFFQSAWFVVLSTVSGLAALWFVYRLRVAQIGHRIRTRLEERLGERERIARELHDTLLQGVQGLILRFQAVADRIPVEDKSREQLEAALATADEVVADARNRVRDLRGAEGTGDLCAIIEHLVATANFEPLLPVRIVVEGKPVPLHPLIAAEVTRIVREALVNIAHHARATSAEIAIGFEGKHLAVRVRDDGVGIPEAVLLHGQKEGHYGMIGMRERAERIGGSLTVCSSPEGGAEVTLTLPAELAYAQRAPGPRGWWRRGKRRSLSDE